LSERTRKAIMNSDLLGQFALNVERYWCTRETSALIPGVTLLQLRQITVALQDGARDAARVRMIRLTQGFPPLVRVEHRGAWIAGSEAAVVKAPRRVEGTVA